MTMKIIVFRMLKGVKNPLSIMVNYGSFSTPVPSTENACLIQTSCPLTSSCLPNVLFTSKIQGNVISVVFVCFEEHLPLPHRSVDSSINQSRDLLTSLKKDFNPW